MSHALSALGNNLYDCCWKMQRYWTTDKGADFKEYSVDFLNQINPYVKDTVIRKAVFGKGAIYAICFPKQPAYTSLKQLKRERYTSLDTLAPYNADHPLWYDYTMAFTGKLFLNVFNPDRVKIEKLHPRFHHGCHGVPPRWVRFFYFLGKREVGWMAYLSFFFEKYRK